MAVINSIRPWISHKKPLQWRTQMKVLGSLVYHVQWREGEVVKGWPVSLNPLVSAKLHLSTPLETTGEILSCPLLMGSPAPANSRTSTEGPFTSSSSNVLLDEHCGWFSHFFEVQ
jgi:hypothetical protein